MIASLQSGLKATFKDVEVSMPADGMMTVLVPRGSIPTVLRYLKEKGLDHLALVSCVDWIEEGELELVYVLTCYMRSNTDYGSEQTVHVLLRTRVPRENPRLESVIGTFENAEPYEREIHELYGVHFDGHPRLIPLFLEREYETPPFRKDFDTRQYVEETFGSIPPVED
ncbi:MAG: NADH-quinone oxidoreductase subunit C [Candidatus Brocadiaceae bacterium]|jgi:NADH-quinone oxidoreductase subunit C